MADNVENAIDLGPATDIGLLAPRDELDPIAPEVRKEKDRAVKNALGTFERLRMWRDEHRDGVWSDIFDAYHGKIDWNPYPYSSVYIIREIFRQMESLKPQIHFRLLGEKKKFDAEPRREGDEDLVAASSAIIHHQIDNLGLFMPISNWLSQAPQWGVSYLLYGWNRFKRFKKKVTRIHHPEGKRLWQRKSEEIVQEGPYLEWKHHRSVFTFPDVDEVQESPAVFVRERVTSEFIKTQVREGLYDKEGARKAIERSTSSNASVFGHRGIITWSDTETDMERDVERDVFLDPNDNFVLTTVWTNGGWVYEFLNDDILVRAQKNPFRKPPILALRNYPQPGRHYGISEVEIMAADQELINNLYSLFIDGLHFSNQPMFLARKGEEANWEATSFQPGYTAYVEDPASSVRQLEVNSKSFEINGVISQILNNMQVTTGNTPELTGSAARAKTATVHVRLQEAAASRIEYKVAMFEPQFIKLYQILYDLNAAFLEEDVALRLEGQDGKQVFERYGAEAFDPDMDIMINLPRTTETPEQKQARFLQLYQIWGADPRIEIEPVIEEMARAFNFKNPRRLIANGMRTQEDAVEENMDHAATGIARTARPSERHDLHIAIHAGYMNSPEFSVDSESGEPRLPEFQQTMQEHVARHQNFQEAIAGAQAQAGQGPAQGQEGSGSPLQETDLQTEGQFNNAATGAGQEGALPPV